MKWKLMKTETSYPHIPSPGPVPHVETRGRDSMSIAGADGSLM